MRCFFRGATLLITGLYLSALSPSPLFAKNPTSKEKEEKLAPDAPPEAPPPDADRTDIDELSRLEKELHARWKEESSPPPIPEISPYEGAAPSAPPLLRRNDPGTESLSFPTTSAEQNPPSAPRDAKHKPSLTPLSFAYTHDPLVDAYLDFFTNQGRTYMKRAMERMGKYTPMMERIFQEEGVPTDLFGVAVVESAFNPKAYSYAHASGIWQFIPSTGRIYGLYSDSWYDERRSPEKSTRAAARLLRDLHERLGSWELALAAYNGGLGTVLGNTRHYNTNDFFAIAHLGGWPDQTRFYVPKVLAACIVLKNRRALGFQNIVPEDPWQYELAHIPAGQFSSKVLAQAAGIEESEFLAYNPEILRGYTPPNFPELMVRLPPGKGAQFSQNLARIWPKEKLTFGRHIVRQGETLEDLARYYDLSTKALAALNGIDAKAALVGGTTLLVPLPFGASPKTSSAPDDTETVQVSFPGEFSYPGRRVAYYRVRYKDTLENLARAFDVTSEEIVLWNGLDPNATLISGLIVRLYLSEDFDPSRALLLPPERIRAVKRGKDGEITVTTIPEKSLGKQSKSKKKSYKKKRRGRR